MRSLRPAPPPPFPNRRQPEDVLTPADAVRGLIGVSLLLVLVAGALVWPAEKSGKRYTDRITVIYKQGGRT